MKTALCLICVVCMGCHAGFPTQESHDVYWREHWQNRDKDCIDIAANIAREWVNRGLFHDVWLCIGKVPVEGIANLQIAWHAELIADGRHYGINQRQVAFPKFKILWESEMTLHFEKGYYVFTRGFYELWLCVGRDNITGLKGDLEKFTFQKE